MNHKVDYKVVLIRFSFYGFFFFFGGLVFWFVVVVVLGDFLLVFFNSKGLLEICVLNS